MTTTLEERGIAQIATVAGWTPYTAQGANGWAYPVYNAAGQPYKEKRWKAANGSKPKFRWLWQKPDMAKYYFLPGALSEIVNHNGEVWLTGGETNTLVFNAAGIKHSIFWFDGEESVPDTLASDLAHMGAVLVHYAPDRDRAGMISAHKVRTALDGTGIALVLYQLPGEFSGAHGYDAGDLWKDCEFKPDVFLQRLETLPALDAIEAYLHTLPARDGQAPDVTGKVQAWRNEWAKSIMDAMGPPAAKEGNTLRWHCPLPGHDDQTPSFTFRDKNTPGFYWPMCSCGIQDRTNALDLVAEARGVPSWEDFKALKAAEEGYTRQPKDTALLERAPSGSPQLPGSAVRWVDMRDIYTQVRAELKTDFSQEIYPMIFPLTILHPFGGFARFTRRGKLTAITGVSGGGKTLLLKTMMITLMKAGYDVIWWGPEWDPYEYAEQDLQRTGGMTMDQLDEWRLWQYYKARGVEKEMSAKYGLSCPGEALVQNSIAKLDEMIAWPGTMYIVDPAFSMSHTEVLETALGLTVLKRREGRDVAALAFDYVQLAQKKGAHDWTWAEQVVNEIKVTCGRAKLHGFVSSQVRKADSEKVRDGATLTQGSAQGLSDAQFNLYLTLTPDVDEDGEFLDTATMRIVKNSRCRRGSVKVFMDWQHLAVLDKAIPKKNINEALKEATDGH